MTDEVVGPLVVVAERGRETDKGLWPDVPGSAIELGGALVFSVCGGSWVDLGCLSWSWSVSWPPF